MPEDLIGAGAELANSSIIGRLLDEISWEGNAKKYRGGGRGKENVLTAEVFYPLSLLPRSWFLGQVIAGAHGAQTARQRVVDEIEEAEVSLLPGDLPLSNSAIRVQPDALLTSPSTYTLIEAKRIRPSRFQADQLAREFVATMQQAGDRVPLLLVILGSPPPVAVDTFPQRVLLEDAIAQRLERLASSWEAPPKPDDLANRISDTLAWTTWDEVRHAVAANRHRAADAPETLAATITRLCDAATTAIDWHS
jgi:hypothetical protein